MKYWFPPNGNAPIYAGDDHAMTAKTILRQPSLNPQDAFRRLIEMGYMRMIVQPSAIYINNPKKSPTASMMRALQDYAMEQKKDLIDDSKGSPKIVWSPRNVMAAKPMRSEEVLDLSGFDGESNAPAELEIDDDPLCGNCNGSGEGYMPGSTCGQCEGLGVPKKPQDSSLAYHFEDSEV